MTLTLDAAIDRSIAPPHPSERLRARAAPSPLRRSLIIVYATLAGCALLTPRPILERLRSAEPGPGRDFADRAFAPLLDASERLGAQPAFDRARARFLGGPDQPMEDYRLRAAFDP